MTLSIPGIDPEELFGLVGGLGLMLLIWSYDDRFRQRAKTHDHVAEVGRMFIFIFGFWMTLYSPYVTVLDTGGRNIFFRFRKQHFRDAFAELNGEGS
jgi:hypothetical protein